MNTIFKLNEKLENLPSILSIEDELFFIDKIGRASCRERV